MSCSSRGLSPKPRRATAPRGSASLAPPTLTGVRRSQPDPTSWTRPLLVARAPHRPPTRRCRGAERPRYLRYKPLNSTRHEGILRWPTKFFVGLPDGEYLFSIDTGSILGGAGSGGCPPPPNTPPARLPPPSQHAHLVLCRPPPSRPPTTGASSEYCVSQRLRLRAAAPPKLVGSAHGAYVLPAGLASSAAAAAERAIAGGGHAPTGRRAAAGPAEHGHGGGRRRLQAGAPTVDSDAEASSQESDDDAGDDYSSRAYMFTVPNVEMDGDETSEAVKQARRALLTTCAY